MGYFQVRYDSRVVNYDRRGFLRLATEVDLPEACIVLNLHSFGIHFLKLQRIFEQSKYSALSICKASK